MGVECIGRWDGMEGIGREKFLEKHVARGGVDDGVAEF